MGKLVDLAEIYEKLEANQNAIIENRSAMISVLEMKIKVLEKRLELANQTIEDQKTIISLLEKEKKEA